MDDTYPADSHDWFPAGSTDGRRQKERIVVLIANESAIDSALIHRMRSEHGAIAPIVVNRGFTDDIVSADPRLVVILASGFDARLLKLCDEVLTLVGGPIIVVGSADQPPDEAAVITMLDAGVDDVVVHGTSIEVLMARVRVAIRTRPSSNSALTQIVIGDLAIDLAAHEVQIARMPVRCPPQQYELLVALARAPNALVSRESLSAALWGPAAAVGNPRRLRTAISLLRAVVGTGPQRPTIENCSRYGYRLVPADVRTTEPSPSDSR